MAGLKIKKGDRVVVLSGKDKGKEGVVQRAMPAEGKVVVEGVNTAKRHRKARTATEVTASQMNNIVGGRPSGGENSSPKPSAVRGAPANIRGARRANRD